MILQCDVALSLWVVVRIRRLFSLLKKIMQEKPTNQVFFISGLNWMKLKKHFSNNFSYAEF